VLNIDELKPQIIKALLPLLPDKIILFGSYAYGIPNDESDIDLFLLKNDLSLDDTRYYQREARKKLLPIRKKYKTNGIDILSAPTDYIEKREDYFYKVDILQNGKVWYERTVS
jgi:predicted nucleotidyltransferase